MGVPARSKGEVEKQERKSRGVKFCLDFGATLTYVMRNAYTGLSCKVALKSMVQLVWKSLV